MLGHSRIGVTHQSGQRLNVDAVDNCPGAEAVAKSVELRIDWQPDLQPGSTYSQCKTGTSPRRFAVRKKDALTWLLSLPDVDKQFDHGRDKWNNAGARYSLRPARLVLRKNDLATFEVDARNIPYAH